MKIENFIKSVAIDAERIQKTVSKNDPFDLDLKINDLKFGSPVPVNEFITSKSLCTPTCGKTGTNNSFCC